ncbi:MAG: glycosyltransferase family 39 protein [Anaerolineae bacterium]|nr:glycosyltransferase family 39 protein [Anaerolineae bacterium]
MQTRSSRPVLYALTLAAIVLLGFSLRVTRLEGQSLWYDEAVTAQVVQQGIGELARWTADDIQPPLYYAAVAGWTQVAGLGEAALRWPSAFFGVLMIVLAFVLARRLFGSAAGLLAALLAAVHPLWVYYSQEARMYTMLTALGMLAGYAILRVLAASKNQDGYPKQRALWWIGFAAAAIALLYTHYFAIFLLLAFGAYFVVVVLVHRGPQTERLLGEGVVATLAVALAYLPWLPNALRRFQVDASYWQGTLKLNEALRHIAISFSTGETVLESQAIPLAWVVSGIGLACFVALAVVAFRPRHSSVTVHRSSLLFVLLYLLVPIVAILALSYRTPKFNPRYLMLASPGLVLLLAGGLALPFSQRGTSAGRTLVRIATGAGILVVLLISAFALRNWYGDPAFTKDDWRGAAAYVRSHIQPDEAVLLVSGHAAPAWRYYAPDLEPVLLPEIETLDVTEVLDLGVAENLNASLASKRGAWLIRWQDNVVDPNGVVPFLLDAAGDLQPVDASFWGLGAPQHFRFVDVVRTGPDDPGTAFPSELPLTADYRGQQLNVNFGDQVELVGYAQPPCPEPLCPVYLFWRGLTPLAADLKLTASLFGSLRDDTWSDPLDRRLAAYDYPTFRWQPGEVVISRIDIPAELGTPPGNYRLRLGVYDAGTSEPLTILDSAGAALGSWTWLDPIVTDGLVTDGPGGPPSGSEAVQIAPEILLRGISVDQTEVEAGDTVAVDAWWQATQAIERDYTVVARWIDPAGTVHSGGAQPLSGTAFPPSRWPVDGLIRGQFDVDLPPVDAAPGQWLLRIGLQGGNNEFSGETVDLPISILPSTRRFEPSGPFDFPSNTSFDFLVDLLGVNAPLTPMKAGDAVPVTVGWRAGPQKMDTSFTGFVHLLNEEGRVVAQDDHVPLQGQRPTTSWAPGEVVEDTYTLQLPADLPPGTYRLEVGLYDANMQGLPRLRTTQGQDSVLIDGFVVEE